MSAEAGFSLDLALEGFEGPLDLLLRLAREQKVDLGQISIVALADQFAAAITAAKPPRIEVAAEWLVMAAWLAYLKSRLLLPPSQRAEEEPDPEAMAEALAARLLALQRVQAAAAMLAGTPQLGRDVFARGAPESFLTMAREGVRADLPGLALAWMGVLRRSRGRTPMTIAVLDLDSIDRALDRLAKGLRGSPGWQTLVGFLPARFRPGSVGARSAVAMTLLGTLELARQGKADLRQDEPFGPILVRPLGEAASEQGGRA